MGNDPWHGFWEMLLHCALNLVQRKDYCDAWSKVEDDHRKEAPQHYHIKRTFVLLRNPKNKNQHHGVPWGIRIHASRYLLPHLEVPRGAAVELLGGLKQIFLVEDPFNFERRCISILWIFIWIQDHWCVWLTGIDLIISLPAARRGIQRADKK